MNLPQQGIPCGTQAALLRQKHRLKGVGHFQMGWSVMTLLRERARRLAHSGAYQLRHAYIEITSIMIFILLCSRNLVFLNCFRANQRNQTKKMKNLIKTNAQKGFSLVELLVVIAVIGVIAAIAIPAMSGIFGKADTTKSKRNAQNIVGTFNAARAAGNVTSYPDAGAAVTAVTSTTGITGGGAFATSNFVVPLSTTEVSLASGSISSIGTGADLTLSVVAQ